MLLPFRCFQHMVFLSCFSIEYNCIRPHRAPYYVVSLIVAFGFVTFHMVNLFSKDFEEINNPNMMFFMRLHTILLLFCLSFFYILNIIQRKDHVRLILKIQKGFRLIRFKQYKMVANRNWFALLQYSVGFIISVGAGREIMTMLYLYTLMYFDVIITYGASIIRLIGDGILLWVAEVEYYSQIGLELDEAKYDEKLKKLHQAYIDLLEAFDIFKKIFKFTVRSEFCEMCEVKDFLL